MTNIFVQCPWCCRTGRANFFEKSFDIADYSTDLMPKENMCKKCKGMGWIALSRLEIKND